MKFKHPCVKSAFFKLVNTFEIDIEFGDDSFTLKIDLFRSQSNSKLYRYRISRTESFNMNPTFPQDKKGKSLHGIATEFFFVEWGLKYLLSGTEFRADNKKNACAKIMKDFGKALEYISSKKIKAQ